MSEKTHDTGFAWFPASHWIRARTRQSVRLDLIAGLSLAAFVIPESLAYASLAQLPPVTGLYCYLVAGIAYAIFGSSRQLAVGPTSAMSLVIATSVVTMTDGDLSRALALASAVALMVAIISIAGRYIGLAIRAHRPRRLVAPRNAYSDARFRSLGLFCTAVSRPTDDACRCCCCHTRHARDHDPENSYIRHRGPRPYSARLLHAGLRRNDFGRSQLCAEAWL